jgi:hypothetical protein
VFYSAAETDTRGQRNVFLLINALRQVNGGHLASKAKRTWRLLGNAGGEFL